MSIYKRTEGFMHLIHDRSAGDRVDYAAGLVNYVLGMSPDTYHEFDHIASLIGAETAEDKQIVRLAIRYLRQDDRVRVSANNHSICYKPATKTNMEKAS